jgi:preprotein translocase subunit Sec61beta
MAQKDKFGKTPAGTAGLMRYEEDTESKLKLEPKIIVFICVAIAILEILMLRLLPI